MSQWRELSNEELFQLDAENMRRIEALQAKGFAIMGEREHYMLSLLEGLHSERSLLAAQEKHAQWLADRLDENEGLAVQMLEQQRQARLLEGVAGAQPNGHAPRTIPGNGRPRR